MANVRAGWLLSTGTDMCAMIQDYARRNLHTYAVRSSASWLFDMCTKFVCLREMSCNLCAILHAYGSIIIMLCATWLMYMCAMWRCMYIIITHARSDSVVCTPWRSHMCTMTHMRTKTHVAVTVKTVGVSQELWSCATRLCASWWRARHEFVVWVSCCLICALWCGHVQRDLTCAHATCCMCFTTHGHMIHSYVFVAQISHIHVCHDWITVVTGDICDISITYVILHSQDTLMCVTEVRHTTYSF